MSDDKHKYVVFAVFTNKQSFVDILSFFRMNFIHSKTASGYQGFTNSFCRFAQ